MKNLLALLLVSATLISLPSLGQKEAFHQRLYFKNQFKKPEQVIQYYVGRDASGFVWSGLLEVERQAFTTWKDVPSNDSFFIAKEYRIQEAKISGKEAVIKVDYEIIAVGDAHGTRIPSLVKDYSVEFKLRKIKGQWKILTPTPDEISPVVLEDKFSG